MSQCVAKSSLAAFPVASEMILVDGDPGRLFKLDVTFDLWSIFYCNSMEKLVMIMT